MAGRGGRPGSRGGWVLHLHGIRGMYRPSGFSFCVIPLFNVNISVLYILLLEEEGDFGKSNFSHIIIKGPCMFGSFFAVV